MALSPVRWTDNSLAAHLVGEVDVDRNAAGGSVPTRFLNLVVEAGMELWDSTDWVFRYTVGSLVTVASQAYVQMPDDFGELAQENLRCSTAATVLRVVTDPVYWRAAADQYLSTDTSEPVLGCIIRDASATENWRSKILLAPTPAAIYTYPYMYMIANPWTAGDLADHDAYPIWPDTFFVGWRLLAKYKIERAWGKKDEADESRKEFDRWMDKQKSENNEMLSRDNQRIQDGYRDHLRFASLCGLPSAGGWRAPSS